MIQIKDRPIACMSASLLTQCPFSSISLYITSFSFLWDSANLLSFSSSYFQPLPLLRLLLFITTLLSPPISSPLPLISSSMRSFVQEPAAVANEANFYIASVLNISRSNLTSNGVKLVQRDIFQTEAQIQEMWQRGWSQGEVQKSSALSDHLTYNMLKGYCGIFAQWHQK